MSLPTNPHGNGAPPSRCVLQEPGCPYRLGRASARSPRSLALLNGEQWPSKAPRSRLAERAAAVLRTVNAPDSTAVGRVQYEQMLDHLVEQRCDLRCFHMDRPPEHRLCVGPKSDQSDDDDHLHEAGPYRAEEGKHAEWAHLSSIGTSAARRAGGPETPYERDDFSVVAKSRRAGGCARLTSRLCSPQTRNRAAKSEATEA